MIKVGVLKKWIKMLGGKSIFHVQQKEGKCYSLYEIKGYYNDLTSKVCDSTQLDENGIPVNVTVGGIKCYFPITIFQYALGLYDLYLMNQEKNYAEKFLRVAEWAINEQKSNGMWECMKTIGDTKHESQSSMCQSEGASLLLRAYLLTNDKKYYKAAKKSIDFMIQDVKDGGTCYYPKENSPIFQEYVSKENLSVLNGWIFSLFGLYDFVLINHNMKYKKILYNSATTMSQSLHKYDRGFWSDYDQYGTIASPAYNDLHVRQLKLMGELFCNKEFLKYAQKWDNYQKSRLKKGVAMLIKLKQKVFKSKFYDINANLVK